ncbi:hypothetical protein M409DRAFT_30573 [Zasmidium cellare ATCC 36951]|uniref:Deacetylase sirtuin-type domain-containing protein n=1 Tax=Zasmidium cellare ATCC 36951 TaxID=1080233 RepID=A0A6A6BWH9_ZASCE|nr:uncharacterized protein M409DRAFT_30573 [Zasmidium cellare ATCC 36951]KAF2158943.1 hypothetical protein M409DRAFT_30573 [Zasmidium cellare ATCC 36951]
MPSDTTNLNDNSMSWSTEDRKSSLGQCIASSQHILALLGAGLSASSGLQTFTGNGTLWRTYQTKSMATKSAFAWNPVLVWQFYEDRRQKAIAAPPNPGHFALAKLAESKEHFFAISQNIDGLSERAGHDLSKLAPIHGSLLTTTCAQPGCSFVSWNGSALPTVPALSLPPGDITDAAVELPDVRIDDLPLCPKCKYGLQRPGVVWFGEQLPQEHLTRTDEWLESVPSVDLLLVVGTSARVFPAAEYIHRARAKGASVAFFNLEQDDDLIEAGDWFVPGDVATTLPRIVAEALDLPQAAANTL